jgi:uncharacterized protein YllA (UPF0747 family)
MSKTVVTGQQTGLLGGPLYTAYKVLGAVRLAREIDGTAVYWLETNDADFNEINHIDYLDKDGHLRSLTWDIDSQGFSCGFIEVDDRLVQLLETFFSSLRQTEFTPGLKRLALDCYSPGRTLGEASQMLAAELFKGLDVRLFTPFEKEFREFSQDILRREAERTPEGDQCNLFCMVGKQRKAVFKKEGALVLRDGANIDPAGHVLVPNVRTRSVCQDAFFKTHTYVAGPGEVKYLAELDEVYEFHDVKKSAVRPRMSAVLIEPRTRRLLKKTGISLEQVMESSREELIKAVLIDKGDFDFNELTKNANRLTGQYLDGLEALGLDAADIKALDKTLRQAVKQASGGLRAREKEKHQRLLNDAGYLSDNLKPFGRPQERVFNVFYYMNLFGGVEFTGWLYDNYDWNRKILEIETGA